MVLLNQVPRTFKADRYANAFPFRRAEKNVCRELEASPALCPALSSIDRALPSRLETNSVYVKCQEKRLGTCILAGLVISKEWTDTE